MTRSYVWTLTMEIPDEGPPRLTDIAVRPALRSALPPGGTRPGTPEPISPPLTDQQRAYLLALAAQKGASTTYALAIQGDMTRAEGRTLHEQLLALPDPHAANAQRQGH